MDVDLLGNPVIEPMRMAAIMAMIEMEAAE
jgi:hypothetical protein